MKNIYVLLGSLLLITACSSDLDQSPPNIANANELTDFTGVLNAAYFYQLGAVTPMAVMGDFRADNALMVESPYTEFDIFTPNLTTMEDQFFGPLYTALYRSILSSNSVIENSSNADEVAEAKFLRGLSYFKLVQAFGDVTVLLTTVKIQDIPDLDLVRKPAAEVYSSVIIPDLTDAIANLTNSSGNGRATKIAAQALLGKVHVTRGDFASAEPLLAAVVNDAGGAGITLNDNFSDIFVTDLNSEIIFATRISGSIEDEYSFTDFWSWFFGLDTKSLSPLDPSLIAAFDASEAGGDTDLRRVVTIDEEAMASPKYPQSGGAEVDWIELRLADVILLYAEALNENGATSDALVELNKIRTRAGLPNSTATTQADVRTAIADERRLELAFEGHRWFDLVRTGTAQSELGFTDPNYLVFPIPDSEVKASFGVITQNDGY